MYVYTYSIGVKVCTCVHRKNSNRKHPSHILLSTLCHVNAFLLVVIVLLVSGKVKIPDFDKDTEKKQREVGKLNVEVNLYWPEMKLPYMAVITSLDVLHIRKLYLLIEHFKYYLLPGNILIKSNEIWPKLIREVFHNTYIEVFSVWNSRRREFFWKFHYITPPTCCLFVVWDTSQFWYLFVSCVCDFRVLLSLSRSYISVCTLAITT